MTIAKKMLEEEMANGKRRIKMKYNIVLSVDEKKNVVKMSTMRNDGTQAIVNNELTEQDIIDLISGLELYKRYLKPPVIKKRGRKKKSEI